MQEIDITNVDLKEFVKAVYSLSKPQGMGFLHFEGGELDDKEAKEIVDNGRKFSMGNVVLDMDYIKGRSCKMTVYKERVGRLRLTCRRYITYPWYDHSDHQFQDLLDRIGVESDIQPDEHGCACTCNECSKT